MPVAEDILTAFHHDAAHKLLLSAAQSRDAKPGQPLIASHFSRVAVQ